LPTKQKGKSPAPHRNTRVEKMEKGKKNTKGRGRISKEVKKPVWGPISQKKKMVGRVGFE